MAGGQRRPAKPAKDEPTSDWRWVALFALLVAGGVTVALAAAPSDRPPLPTFSPEPPPTTPPPVGPTAPPTGTAPADPTPDSEPTPSRSATPTATPTVDERPAAFATVRSMAVLGERLLLGTEDGPWLLPADGGQPEPAPGPRHRLSALVRRADGTLLASGLEEGGAAPLGLVSSTDGREWDAVALDGQALFGRLRVLGGRVYGWDAGSSTLMVSDDLRTWQRRSVEERLLDFAVDPADGERLVRAVPEGGVGLPEVQRSTDGGRTWDRIPAPSLFLFAWREPERLWALTEDGTIFRSRDGGESWSPRGMLPSPPTALVDTGDTLYAALQTVGVYRSTDDGSSWHRLDEP